MTIRQYIEQKFVSIGKISDADIEDVASAGGFSPDDEYGADVAAAVGMGICSLIEEKVLAPFVSNVSESGFSMSWDRTNLAKYYWWLCKKYGVTPDDEVLSLLGISMIRDMSDIW